mgnify:CR=1 FL=1
MTPPKWADPPDNVVCLADSIYSLEQEGTKRVHVWRGMLARFKPKPSRWTVSKGFGGMGVQLTIGNETWTESNHESAKNNNPNR